MYILNGFLFGIGLAVDAFLIALANGLHYSDMKKRKIAAIAALFSAFQLAMPLIGWLVMRTVAVKLTFFDEALSWIAFAIMIVLGVKMICDGVFGARKDDPPKPHKLCLRAILVQCFATSLDALSVGFVISDYVFSAALVCSVIIALITFAVFPAGFAVGKRCGLKFADHANVIGGIVMICIGVEILVTSLL